MITNGKNTVLEGRFAQQFRVPLVATGRVGRLQQVDAVDSQSNQRYGISFACV
jgi:hypothetical protein